MTHQISWKRSATRPLKESRFHIHQFSCDPFHQRFHAKTFRICAKNSMALFVLHSGTLFIPQSNDIIYRCSAENRTKLKSLVFPFKTGLGK